MNYQTSDDYINRALERGNSLEQAEIGWKNLQRGIQEALEKTQQE